MSPSVGEPGYLPYCGGCSTMARMVRRESFFECRFCGLRTRRINGEDMFDRTALPRDSGRLPEGHDPASGHGAKQARAAAESGIAQTIVEGD